MTRWPVPLRALACSLAKFRAWYCAARDAGPTRAQLAARVEELTRIENQAFVMTRALRKELEKAHAQAQVAAKELEEARGLLAELRASLPERFIEPPPVEGCVKIRLHTREEAKAFAAKVAAQTGAAPDVYRLYKCPTCPRNPITAERIWHIAHDTTAEGRTAKARSETRKIVGARRAQQGGTRIGDRIDPTVLARIARPDRSIEEADG